MPSNSVTLDDLVVACRAVAQSLLDHPEFDGIIVAPGQIASFKEAARDDRRAALWGVTIRETPMMPVNRAALTHRGEIVQIINWGPTDE